MKQIKPTFLKKAKILMTSLGCALLLTGVMALGAYIALNDPSADGLVVQRMDVQDHQTRKLHDDDCNPRLYDCDDDDDDDDRYGHDHHDDHDDDCDDNRHRRYDDCDDDDRYGHHDDDDHDDGRYGRRHRDRDDGRY